MRTKKNLLPSLDELDDQSEDSDRVFVISPKARKGEFGGVQGLGTLYLES